MIKKDKFPDLTDVSPLQMSKDTEVAYLKKDTEAQALSPELEYKIHEHGYICDALKELYVAKNADYGDSMHPLFEEYGLTAFLVLFGTKINRIKSLKDKDKGNYESLEDSLADLANYAIIAMTELRAKKHFEQEKALKEYEDANWGK